MYCLRFPVRIQLCVGRKKYNPDLSANTSQLTYSVTKCVMHSTEGNTIPSRMYSPI
uniref:Uncharacterized protein n=1 Tax=Anguilla anguilla TaxID=7936 RepID=A0A0E9P5L6_ANGAN